MEPTTNLEHFLLWSQDMNAEFPDLQYPLEQQEDFCWNEFLDQYIDPFQLEAEAAPPGEEPVPTVESLPELTLAPSVGESDTCEMNQLLVDLQNRVGDLENMIAQKERTINALESYVEQLQPYLLQLSNSVQEMQMKATVG
ncbi:hypothetical protein N7533_013750 [Penicillium manginii]|uniref:uncharacterized protein n=1 Tax=Penicillium manginii TaxID=203109 RepID=UPI002546F9F2|nr:uncharacterized protein N7533_013750 [Penicillium manginii]KAJ5733303.1 hypothetical protein N7533_013750 [Penicillium manginii]